MPSYIESYNHQNRIVVLLELQCRDAWTLRTPEFLDFAHELALHVAATGNTGNLLSKQPFFRNTNETVDDQLRKISATLGVMREITQSRH